jgi:hypothetical protein
LKDKAAAVRGPSNDDAEGDKSNVNHGLNTKDDNLVVLTYEDDDTVYVKVREMNELWIWLMHAPA